MAYIHKAIVYFIDPSEEFENVNAIAEEMGNYDYLPYMKVGESETKDFDWDDNVIVNRGDCTGEQAEKFFQSVKPKEIIPTYWYRVILTNNGVEDVSLLNDSRRVKIQDVFETRNANALNSEVIPFYYVDVEAESLEQAEYIAKEKVIKYISEKRFKELERIKEKYFNK